MGWIADGSQPSIELGSAMAQHYRAIQLLQDPGLPGKVTIGGRERPWLSKVLRFALQPLARWRLYRWRRLWQPQLDRIAAELAAELPGGHTHPEFQAKVLTRLRAWLREHPEAGSLARVNRSFTCRSVRAA